MPLDAILVGQTADLNAGVLLRGSLGAQGLNADLFGHFENPKGVLLLPIQNYEVGKTSHKTSCETAPVRM